MVCLLASFAVSAAAPVTAQQQPSEPEVTRMPLMTKVLGPYSRPISTTSPTARAYFDQGLQMVYAFTHSVAIRSFEEAQRQDPTCAMCYWGEALARGPFLNGGLRDANVGPAHEAAGRALALLDERSTAVERALIEAMAVRYEEEQQPDTRAALDSAYSDLMAEAYRAHPTDPDVGALYAESLMLLNPVRAQYQATDPFVQSVHGVLEGVLARNITHPGACHLYIHATEATAVAERAEACADHLGQAIPGASHINHMPSHTYNQIGRWASAVRANLDAWHSDQRAEFGEGVSYAATHNLHMLLFAASMDGQGAVAALAGKEYAKVVTDGAFYHALALLRFGRFDEILSLAEAPERELQRGLWDFARGYAHLRSGSPDSARVYLARVDEAADTLPESVTMRGHTAADLLGITGDILRGELLLSEGRSEEAIAAFEAAVRTHDGLRYDEPEPLNFSARHWLGAALLEAGRHAEAEQVYRAALEQHPRNGWSLYGLEDAVRAQGRAEEGDRVHADFEEAWERSDTMIRSSRF